MVETPRIKAISIIVPSGLFVEWMDGGTDRIDLSGWIGNGGGILEPLKKGPVFSEASIGDFGSSVEWVSQGEDCAIDAVHLRKIAEEQLHRKPRKTA